MSYNVFLNNANLQIFNNIKSSKTEKTEGLTNPIFKSENIELTDTFEKTTETAEEITEDKNGGVKKLTKYSDGSFDEIYTNKNSISYVRIKRFNGEKDYTETYYDSTGFCGKETFTVLNDGTTVSTNEFSNGKNYTETYKQNPDGGFTRVMKKDDNTGYIETQKFNIDGSSSYSIQNDDGSSNTVTYFPDGSYIETVIDSSGNKKVNKYGV